ncbi:MAG TPA: glycosyltransferase, partial [Planctomycetota bacterium]|nr:glycosyltransferase [Planctomycetota bacterium]
KFGRYPTVRLPANVGQAAARNVGVRCLKTKYVLFLDGDVIMKPHMIEAMEKVLEGNSDVSIAYCHYDRHGSRTDHVRSNPWDPKRLMSVNYISMISMVRKEHLPTPVMDETLRRYEDWDLWIRMMKSGYCGQLINEALFTAHYRKGDLSGTGESDEWRKIVEKKHGVQRERVHRR